MRRLAEQLRSAVIGRVPRLATPRPAAHGIISGALAGVAALHEWHREPLGNSSHK